MKGWKPYYVNFMFEPLGGNADAVMQKMKSAIEYGFYGALCKRFAHHPRKPSQQARLPKLWLFPDRPCRKRDEKTPIEEMRFNDNGCHFNGPMMIPPISRFKGNPIRLIHDNSRLFCVRGIDRIYVQACNHDLDRVADYAGKTIKWDRKLCEHIVVLPDDKVAKPLTPLTDQQRAIRDIQARHNVSDETATLLAISAVKGSQDVV